MWRALALIAISGVGWHLLEPPVTMANVVGPKDDRVSIKEMGRSVGLKDSEIGQLRDSIGFVNCPGQKSPWATGFLIADDVVVTVGHVFFDRRGQLRAPLEQCFFETEGDRAGQRLYFKSDAMSFRSGGLNAIGEFAKDYAVIRLQRSVEGAKPLKFVSSLAILRDNLPIITVVANREPRYRVKGENPYEPLAQNCVVKHAYPLLTSIPTFYSDCDNTSGGSGGPNLVREIDGSLLVIGILCAGGLANMDFKPYSERVGEKSLALSVAIGDAFLRDINAVLFGGRFEARSENGCLLAGHPSRMFRSVACRCTN